MPFPRNYADILAAQAMAVPEEQLAAEIDRLDLVTLGASGDGVSATGSWPDLDAVDPRPMVKAMTLRMLLRTRQLAQQHDPDAVERRVRDRARTFAPIFDAVRQRDTEPTA